MSSAAKPDLLERLGVALGGDAGMDEDLIGAMAYAQTNPNAEEHDARASAEIDPGTELGGLLVRLKFARDSSVALRTCLLLERWVRHQRAFRKWKMRQGAGDLVTRFVRQCLDEWLHPTCGECFGRQLVGLDRGEIVERRIRCSSCKGHGWLMRGVRRDCGTCRGSGWRQHAKVRQRKTEQCTRCKGTGQRIASDAERALAIGVDVRVYERHWAKRFSWLASGLDRLEHTEKRCLQSQMRAGITRA